MSEQHAPERDGHPPAACGGAALRIASGGLRTLRDCTNFSAALAIDALRGDVGHRAGNLAVRSMETTRRFIEAGQKHGQRTDVLDAVGRQSATDPVEDALQRRELELTAELEALRERRGA